MALVIYGAGGHGRVIAEAAASAGLHVLGFVDDEHNAGRELAWPVLDRNDPRLGRAFWIVGIGHNRTRQQIGLELQSQGRQLGSVVHPTASVSVSVQIGHGVFIGPRCVVNSQARIADGVIVNSGAIIEHDCQLQQCCHIAPGAVLGGAVTVGQAALVGLNACVLPRVSIGNYSVIGAGAVVTRDVPPHQTATGSPATVRD